MINRYHLYLDGVPFAIPSIEVPDLSKNFHSKIGKHQLCEDFIDWVYERDLVLRDDYAGEYFYTPPGGQVPLHTDKHEINDYVKLNWMVGGDASLMNWYELKPGKTLHPPAYTGLHGAYAGAAPEDVVLVHSARIGKPSLVNVGRLHELINGPEASHVYCVYVDDPRTGKRISWSEASTMFFVDCIKKI